MAACLLWMPMTSDVSAEGGSTTAPSDGRTVATAYGRER